MYSTETQTLNWKMFSHTFTLNIKFNTLIADTTRRGFYLDVLYQKCLRFNNMIYNILVTHYYCIFSKIDGMKPLVFSPLRYNGSIMVYNNVFLSNLVDIILMFSEIDRV